MTRHECSAQLNSRTRKWAGEIRDESGEIVHRTGATFDSPGEAVTQMERTRDRERALKIGSGK